MAGEEHVEGERRVLERLMLSLRTPAGVPDWALPGDDRLEGLVEQRGERAVLTVRGRLLANVVAGMLRAGPVGHSPAASSEAASGRYPAVP